MNEFDVPSSLWEKIKSETDLHLMLEDALGESFVEENVALHKELCTLFDIWKEFHADQKITMETLPEPPLLRENIGQQIRMLVEVLEEKKTRKTSCRSVCHLLSDQEKDMLEKLTRDIADTTASGLAHSDIADTTTPGLLTQRNFSCPLSQLNDAMQFEELLPMLKVDFEIEQKCLLEEIEFVQRSLMKESEARLKPSKTPSIAEMKGLARKLEQEVLRNDNSQVLRTDRARVSVTSPLRHTRTIDRNLVPGPSVKSSLTGNDSKFRKPLFL